jgi:hypothetical protein
MVGLTGLLLAVFRVYWRKIVSYPHNASDARLRDSLRSPFGTTQSFMLRDGGHIGRAQLTLFVRRRRAGTIRTTNVSVAKNPGELTPPDDTGSTTFQRFRYQAHVAFPFVLACGLGSDVLSVILEHIEDLVLECRDCWRFIQVKTRDAERGPWRLSDLTTTGGALHSLHRSYEAVKELSVATTHELFLEGTAHRTDDIQLLRNAEGRATEALQDKIGEALNIIKEDAGRFLQRLRLKTNVPTRSAIQATNMRSLGSQAPHLTAGTLESIYSGIVRNLDDAMAAELGTVLWGDILRHPDDTDAATRALFEAKRLTRDMIHPLLGPVTGAVRPLLQRFLDPNAAAPTALEQKLLSGGATSEIVRHAQVMRAKATILATEYAATAFGDEDDYLADIEERLLVVIDGLRAAHAVSPTPAPLIWNDLVTRLPGLADTVDLRQIFRRDPYMLLGHICELSDQCVTDWGRARDA